MPAQCEQSREFPITPEQALQSEFSATLRWMFDQPHLWAKMSSSAISSETSHYYRAAMPDGLERHLVVSNTGRAEQLKRKATESLEVDLRIEEYAEDGAVFALQGTTRLLFDYYNALGMDPNTRANGVVAYYPANMDPSQSPLEAPQSFGQYVLRIPEVVEYFDGSQAIQYQREVFPLNTQNGQSSWQESSLVTQAVELGTALRGSEYVGVLPGYGKEE